MGVVDKAVGAVKEVGKAYGDWVSESTNKSIDPPSPSTPDKDHAVKTAADSGDIGTVKSLVGEHPDSIYSKTPRHPHGRGIPANHPALQ